MARSFELEVVTPERVVLRETVDFVLVPSSEGLYGMLAGHAPMVGLLRPGVVHYRRGDAEGVVAVSGGFFEVEPERTLILADEAELPEEVDVEAAIAERDRARRLLEEGGDQETVRQAKESLERALARLRAAQRE